MSKFLDKLKDLFEKIPSKTNFLRDLGFGGSYTGFRYFLQERSSSPSEKFMTKLSDELGYEYVYIPIKEEHQELIDTIHNDFVNDLEVYVEKYEGDTTRVYTKNQESSSLSAVVEAFELAKLEKDIMDPNKQIDISGLFE